MNTFGDVFAGFFVAHVTCGGHERADDVLLQSVHNMSELIVRVARVTHAGCVSIIVVFASDVSFAALLVAPRRRHRLRWSTTRTHGTVGNDLAEFEHSGSDLLLSAGTSELMQVVGTVIAHGFD